MPRYSVTICPDCSATLGAGGQAVVTTTDEGLTCVHATAVDYRDPPKVERTAALVTIISMRPQSMMPEIRTLALRQVDLDGLAQQRPGLSPADWARECLNIDLESVYADAEFGKPESEDGPRSNVEGCHICPCTRYIGKRLLSGEWERCVDCNHLAQDHS